MAKGSWGAIAKGYDVRMATAAYVRVSSQGQSVATQRDAIERVARTRGQRVDVWFAEKTGGAAVRRAELDALRSAVQRGEFSRVYVYRLDRLSRRGIRATFAILEQFRACGCELVTVADGFSLDGPAADVVVAVLAWAAQMERQAIGERISAARMRIEAAGGAWGQPRKVSPRQVAEVQRLRKEGRTVRQISMALKITKSTVGNVLSKKGAYSDGRSVPEKNSKSEGRPSLSK